MKITGTVSTAKYANLNCRIYLFLILSAFIDLQKEVHEGMKANFSRYPNLWGLTKPDRNIDHRRVPNLMVFFYSLSKLTQLSSL
ncbi:MAG: DUF1287 domain-containing protein [Mangrovibacterium sp.]